MTPFEEYTKDWKNIAGSASSFNNDFLKQKNETIMKKLIEFEQEEKSNINKGFMRGSIGIIVGLLFGIGLPVYDGAIELTFPMILGIVMMFAAIILFFVTSLRQRIPTDITDQPTISYLQSVLGRLKNKKNNMAKIGILYTTILCLGIFSIYYSIFGGFGTDLMLAFLMPVALGVIAYLIWNRTYAKREETKIRPLIEEIESMIAKLQHT